MQLLVWVIKLVLQQNNTIDLWQIVSYHSRPRVSAATTSADIRAAVASHTVSSFTRRAMTITSITTLIQQCSLETELTPPAELTLSALDAALEEGRPKALTYLKESGVDKLGHRQKLVNEFSKAKREGRVKEGAEPAADASSTAAAVLDVSDDAGPPTAGPAAPVGVLRWVVDISIWEPGKAEWDMLVNALPKEEADKVLRFKFVADQKRALVSRYLQRRACFETTGVAWKKVEIARTKGGKPFMKNKPAPPTAAGLHANWNFNVSHEGKYVVLAAEPRLVCGIDVAAPEEARAGKKSRGADDLLKTMKGQLSPSEWAAIEASRPNEHAMEETFRKFWSLKEAYTKGRGDGLGFEFNRTDFALGAQGKGTEGQPVQRATVKVDKQPLSQWGFYIQPLEADHWISTARGPPSDVVDAHGVFLGTFGEQRIAAAQVSEQLNLKEPPFVKKSIGDLIAEDMREAWTRL